VPDNSAMFWPIGLPWWLQAVWGAIQSDVEIPLTSMALQATPNDEI